MQIQMFLFIALDYIMKIKFIYIDSELEVNKIQTLNPKDIKVYIIIM